MMDSFAGTSPRLKARMAGAFYVLTGLTSVIGGMYIPGKLVVVGDAATTANAILAHEHLFETRILSNAYRHRVLHSSDGPLL